MRGAGGVVAISTAALAALNVAEGEACKNPRVDAATAGRVARIASRVRDSWGDITPELKEVLLMRLLAAVPAARAGAGLAPVRAGAFELALSQLCEQHSMRCVDDAALVHNAHVLYLTGYVTM